LIGAWPTRNALRLKSFSPAQPSQGPTLQSDTTAKPVSGALGAWHQALMSRPSSDGWYEDLAPLAAVTSVIGPFLDLVAVGESAYSVIPTRALANLKIAAAFDAKLRSRI
jgi:hypothetical protein